MFNRCRKNLDNYIPGRLSLFVGDAFKFFDSHPLGHLDFAASSWTLHNFPRKKRTELLSRVYDALSPDGVLVVMDKVIPDSQEIERIMVDHMFKQYDELLLPKGKTDLCDSIKAHELQDHKRPYRLTETEFTDDLKDLGFRDIVMPVRIWREALVLARKP